MTVRPALAGISGILVTPFDADDHAALEAADYPLAMRLIGSPTDYSKRMKEARAERERIIHIANIRAE